MDARSLDRSRAEILLAELLVEDANPPLSRVQELGLQHPELAADLERLHAQLGAMRVLTSAAHTPRAGSEHPPVLGNFRCTRLLGRGGMGEVWEAEDSALGRHVALKLLRDSWSSTAVQQQRFQREAQAASRVQHSGIVAIYQTGEWQGRHYIVQELVPGGRTLRDEIEELRRLGELQSDHPRAVAQRFEKIADALVAAHAVGVVHRDIKPQNVLLTPAGEPKVADFGLAYLSCDTALSRTGEFLGTYMYASPEQVDSAAGAVDARSDIFSLAATLYENLTLHRAFDGDSVREVTRALSLEDPTPPHLVRSKVPYDLSVICMKALEKRQDDRYHSMLELRDDLRRFLANQPILARPPSALRRAWKWALRHPTMATTLTIVSAASAGLLYLFLNAERARAFAAQESAAAEEVIAFLVNMLEQALPGQSDGDVPTVRDVVKHSIQQLEQGEIKDERVQARLLSCLGTISGALGEHAVSAKLLNKSVVLWQHLANEDEPRVLEAKLSLAMVLTETDQSQKAFALLEPLLARIERDPAFAAKAGASVTMAQGDIFESEGRFEEAKLAFTRATELYRLGPPRPELEYDLRYNIASVEFMLGNREKARGFYQALVDDAPQAIERGDPDLLDAVNVLGMILIDDGKLDEAEALFERLIEIGIRTLPPEHPTLVMFRTNLARVWESMGRYVDAEALFRENIDQLALESAPDSVELTANWNNVATCLIRQERIAEAEEIFRDIYEKQLARWGISHRAVLRTQHNLAQALIYLDRLEEALVLQQSSVDHTPPDDPSAASRREQLEEIKRRLGPGH